MRLREITTKPMFRTTPPNPDWEGRMRDRKNTADTTHDDPDIERLKQVLLSYGGWTLAPQHDPDLKEVLERGQIWNGRGSIAMRGRPINCHSNTSRLWLKGLVRICTGYALSRDGCWRQHSWGLDKDGKIVETTLKRVAYFGFVLSDEEAKEFANNNR